MVRAIIIHGNSGSKPTDNWFPYLKAELEKRGIQVEAPQFPDSDLARASFWLPFLDDLKPDANTIIIGHSSGAIAAMRYAEKHRILGSVLVGTYHTHLDIKKEKVSGYFDTPWDWEAIKRNQQWIIQFAGNNDPWIPIEEARYVRDKLNVDYHELDQGHFGGDYYKPIFPEALEAIMLKLSNPYLVESFVKRVWDDKDFSAIQDSIHPKCVIHSLLGDFYGPEALTKMIQVWQRAFPDLAIKNVAVISEKDLVVVHWKASGHHRGEFKDIAPTGKPVSYSGVTIYRIQDRKIAEYWAFLDMQHLLQQLKG